MNDSIPSHPHGFFDSIEGAKAWDRQAKRRRHETDRERGRSEAVKPTEEVKELWDPEGEEAKTWNRVGEVKGFPFFFLCEVGRTSERNLSRTQSAGSGLRYSYHAYRLWPLP